ncbi:MAG: LysM peptidoglycan-binding domain-containing protein, partial [Desulfobacterales bacterium]
MKTGKRYQTRVGIIGLLVIFTFLGCSGLRPKLVQWKASVTDTFNETFNFSDSESPTRTDQVKNDTYFIHTSRWSWETLGVLADWYTKDSRNWKKLADINPDVNPQKIAPGSEVFIPVKLLKTRQALPKNYAGNYCKKCYRHTVRWPGESMSLIANWYTGSAQNWRKLAKANPGIDPNRIKKGNVILIPPAMLKTKEALPQKVAAR